MVELRRSDEAGGLNLMLQSASLRITRDGIGGDDAGSLTELIEAELAFGVRSSMI